ncbi:hypothetical protein DSO57_1008745 [Entomophthora muscae]|uniref:Uncharacterized protein n=1 Tax=Entomophthora muscae TaxID=34485 RepID=A0ACC2TI07_9FUNG|nr:hypothetical protein DSO57_1008745 [Entomophthora muscae]
MKEETKKLPIERGSPRDDKSHNPTRKHEYSKFKPANEITPAMDATEDWENLVNISPNPVYLEFTLEEILIYNPEAITRETETVYRKGHKITIPPLLFCNKYNHLPTYLIPMTLPLTPQPNHPQESVAANKSTFTQIFGVMYITLTGLIDSMLPASGPWALLGKLLSYIVKLAPILWWALPAGPASSQEPPTGWIPGTWSNLFVPTSVLALLQTQVVSQVILRLPHYQLFLSHTLSTPGSF